MRTIIDLPDSQIAALRELSEREQASRAELIRRAVATYVNAHQPATCDDAAFGLWRDRREAGAGGLAYQREKRAEWDGR
ncbi:ribbon-helix-helix domain-containing protein [Spiribacter pallidus]|jgi:predicted transcriptional regulator|uniref:ribbon-helix-helix domain-containing protein n=1 Tax=Spiribacter pallidus TaxID=1987936 RepID=UPI00349FF952